MTTRQGERSGLAVDHPRQRILGVVQTVERSALPGSQRHTRTGTHAGGSSRSAIGRVLRPAFPRRRYKTPDVLARIAGLGDEDLLLDAGIDGLEECIGETRPAFVLAVEVRQGFPHFGHRLLLIHDSMMPHSCGLPDPNTCETCRMPTCVCLRNVA